MKKQPYFLVTGPDGIPLAAICKQDIVAISQTGKTITVLLRGPDARLTFDTTDNAVRQWAQEIWA
jgi:hypothetical protein